MAYVTGHVGHPPYTWGNGVSKTIDLSTLDSEAKLASNCTRQLVHDRNLHIELSATSKYYDQTAITVQECDNRAAALAADPHVPVYSDRTKHHDIQHKVIFEKVREGWLKIRKVSGKVSFNDPESGIVPDILTKPASKGLLKHYIPRLQ